MLRRGAWDCGGIGLSLIACAVAALAECPDAEKPLTEIGRRFADPRELTASHSVETIDHHAVGLTPVSYLRVLLEVQGVANDWYLTVRDAQFHVVQAFGPPDFAQSPKRWTTRVPGATAHFDLDAQTDSPVRVVLHEYIAMPASAKAPYYAYSLKGDTATYKPLYDSPTEMRRFGDSVGFLMSSWGQASWCCSGVLIAPDLFLTNWHCGGTDPKTEVEYWNQQICDNTLLDLSWDDDRLSREYLCTTVVAKDRALDFAILRVAAVASVGQARPAVVSGAPAPLGPIVVVHHPACQQKQISFGCSAQQADYPNWLDDRVTPLPEHTPLAETATDFTHDCDTERGSSGAPVFDAAGTLVGLHHLGFKIDPQTCKATDHVNKAVRTHRIVEFLRRQYPELIGRLTLR